MAEILKLAVAISAINRFGSAFAEAAAGATGVKAAVAGMAAGFIAAGPAIAVFAADMAIDFVKSSVEAASAFEKEMLRVQAVTQATVDEMEHMKEVALDLGATTEWTAQQSAEAFTAFGMAGFSVEEAIATVPVSLDLATASMTDMITTSRVLANVIRAFNLDVTKASHVGDVLTSTFTGSFSTIEDLMNTFKMAAPMAKAVGWTFEEVAAAAGKLGDAGIKGTLAGTGLRQAITKMLKPTAEAWEVISDLELEIHKFTDDGWDLKAQIDELVPTLNSERAELEALEKITRDHGAAVASTNLELAQNSFQISTLEFGIKKLEGAYTSIGAALSKAQDNFASSDAAYQDVSESLKILNAELSIHEENLNTTMGGYEEFNGNLLNLQTQMDEVNESLSINSDIISRNNLEISLHRAVIDDAMDGYVEWRGDIDKLETEIDNLRMRLSSLNIDEKKNQLEMMEIRRKAESTGRELTLSEETRLNYIASKNAAIAIKKEEISLSEMETQQKLEEEKRKADEENARRMATIMTAINDESAAIDELTRQNEELQIVSSNMTIQKLELTKQVRAEEELVTAENERRMAIVLKNSVEEQNTINILKSKIAELSAIEREANLARLMDGENVRQLNIKRNEELSTLTSSEISQIEMIKAANEELALSRGGQNLELQKTRTEMELGQLSVSNMEEELYDLSEAVNYQIDGLVPLVDVIKQLEDAGSTAAQEVTIFGIRGGTSMLSLKERGSESLRAFTEEITNHEGILEDMTELIRTSVSTQLDVMTSKWNAMKIEVGTALFPALVSILELFKAFMPVMGPLIVFYVDFYTSGLLPVAKALQTVIEVLGPLTTAFSENEFAMFALKNMLILGLLPAIGGILVPIRGLIFFSDKLGIQWDKVGAVFVKVGGFIFKYLSAPFKGIFNDWKWIWEKLLIPLGKFIGESFVHDFERWSDAVKKMDHDVFRPLYLQTLKPLYENVLVPMGDILGDIIESYRAFKEGGMISALGDLGNAIGFPKHHSGTGFAGAPSDEIAILQEGEIVLNRGESQTFRDMMKYGGNMGGGGINIQNLIIHANSEEEGRSAVRGMMKELKSLGLRGMTGGL